MNTKSPLLTSILEIPDLSSGAVRALIGLISFRNKSSGLCCPRIATLCQRLGVAYGTVRRWLRELRGAGILVTTKRRGSNSYRIELPKSCGKQSGGERPDSPEMDAVHSPEMDGQDRPLLDAQAGSILIEQTDRNRQIRTVAADVKLEGVREPVKKAAAAAAQDCFAFENENATQRPAPEALVMAEMVVAELMPQHPEPGNEPKAVAEAAKILAAKPEEMAATIETMRRVHAAFRIQWAGYGPERFIPQLQKWFRDGDWKRERPERKEAQRETYGQRRRREIQQSDDEFFRTYAELEMWDAIRSYGGDELVEVWREKVKQAS